MLVCGDEVNTLYFYESKSQKLLNKNSNAHKEGLCDIVFKGEYGMYSSGFDGKVAYFDIRNLE